MCNFFIKLLLELKLINQLINSNKREVIPEQI